MTDKKIPDDLLKEIEKYKDKKNSESYLISFLHLLQDRFGHLDKDMLQELAYLTNIPFAKITGVATFYNYFRLNPKGKHVIHICLGTACHVKGADEVVKKFQEELGIKLGETTKDGFFTLEKTRCLGACALAPVVKIDDEVYSNVTPEKVSKIIESYYKKSSS